MKLSVVQPRTPRLPVVPRFVSASELGEIASHARDLPDSFWTKEFYSADVGRLLGHIAALELLNADESLPNKSGSGPRS